MQIGNFVNLAGFSLFCARGQCPAFWYFYIPRCRLYLSCSSVSRIDIYSRKRERELENTVLGSLMLTPSLLHRQVVDSLVVTSLSEWHHWVDGTAECDSLTTCNVIVRSSVADPGGGVVSGSVGPYVLGLLDQDQDPFVRGTDPDPSSKNSKKTLSSYCFVTSLWLFILEKWWKDSFKK